MKDERTKKMVELYEQLDAVVDTLENLTQWSRFSKEEESKLGELLLLVKAERDSIKAIDRPDGTVLEYIKYQTPSICLAAVQDYGNALRYVQAQTPEICMAAVRQFGYALHYVKEQTPEICMAAVQQKGYALRYVKTQTPEICLAAVQQKGYALKYVENQTPEICMAAVQARGNDFFENIEGGRILQYVKEQTPEICMAAVERNGMELKYVHDITPEICEKAIRSLEVGLANEGFGEWRYGAVLDEYYPLAQGLYQNAIQAQAQSLRKPSIQERLQKAVKMVTERDAAAAPKQERAEKRQSMER